MTSGNLFGNATMRSGHALVTIARPGGWVDSGWVADIATSHAMSKDEMRKVLSEHLAKFRTWSYAQLGERVERDHQAHDCLEHIEGIAPNGTQYQMEQALWDDKPHGNVRVCGELSAEPQNGLLGFVPIYTPDVTDSFIMSPERRFVGETPGA